MGTLRTALVGQTGILSIKKNGEQVSRYRADLGDAEIDISSAEKTTTTGKFSTINGGKLKSCIVAFEPKQSGSGDPSPSNVRPITGHTAVGVDACGINIFSPLSYETVDLTGSGAYRYGHIYSTGTYTIINKSAQQISYRLPKADLSDRGTTVNIEANSSATVTVDATHVLWVFMFTWSSSVAEMICVRKDSDTTFVDFNGTDYTIPIGQTVYSGSLDVVSGVGSVSDGYVDLGSLNYTYDSANQRFYTDDLTNANISYDVRRTPFICSCYQAITDGRPIADVPNGSVYNASYNKRIYIHDSRYTVPSDLKTALSGQTLVYPLATASSFSTTPQQINTLVGENNIDIPLEGQSLTSAVYRELFAWDDVNDVVDKVDAKNADVSAIGTDESGRTTASRAYAQGDIFYKDGFIGEALTAVASGATWTLNTNYKQTTLAEIVAALRA